jgi:hypothetical protein
MAQYLIDHAPPSRLYGRRWRGRRPASDRSTAIATLFSALSAASVDSPSLMIFTTGNRRRHRRGVFRHGHRHLGGPALLRQLRELGAIEPQARFFAMDRGLALLVRKDNPFGIQGLADSRPHWRAHRAAGCRRGGGLAGPYRATVSKLTGSAEADALSAADGAFAPGRLSIVH